MIFVGILVSMATIAFFCWLLFTLAVFALPLFASITAGKWAYGTGAGWLGAILVGFAAAALTFGLGRFLHSAVRTTWGAPADRCRVRLPGRSGGLPRHLWHRESHHALPNMADGVFDPRSRRRRHCRLRAHHRKEDVRPL